MTEIVLADDLSPVLATLPGEQLRIAFRWLGLVRMIVGRPPDLIGDLVVLRAQLIEVARAMPRPEPDPFWLVSLRYGLRDGNPMTLPDVAMRLRYTRERIRQVENEVLRRMHYPPYWQSLHSGFYVESGDLY